MKMYWNGLNHREQWMLGFGGVFCFFLLLYLLLFAPLNKAVHDKSQQLVEKQKTYVWMQQARLQHGTAKVHQVLSNGKLLTVLASQLKSTSFHRLPYQLQQTGAGDLQLSFDLVPYNAFMTWLWSFNQQYAFSIKQFSAERTDTPGVVKIMLTITH